MTRPGEGGGEPGVRRVAVSAARDQLAELVNRAGYGRERVYLTRRGRPVAVLVALDDVRDYDGSAATEGVGGKPATPGAKR